MIFFYIIIVASIVAVIGVQLYWIAMINRQRKELQEVNQEQITMFDVRELLMEGEHELAVRVYKDLFNVNDEQAEKEVAELERSMNL